MSKSVRVSSIDEYQELQESVGSEAFEVIVNQLVYLLDEVRIWEPQASDLKENRDNPHLWDSSGVTDNRIEQEVPEPLIEPILSKLEVFPKEVYQ